MEITDYPSLDNFNKTVLVEINAGIEPTGDYTATGSGSWGIDIDCHELVSVQENGVELTRRYSISDCDSTTGSYFHDFDNLKLYIHTGGDDDPKIKPVSTYKYIFIGSCWLGFTNKQEKTNPLIFTPDGATKDIYYYPLIKSIPSITQNIGDYYTTAITTQFGGISFSGAGFWWETRKKYIYHNRAVNIKIGHIDADYADYVTIFPAICRDINFSNQTIELDMLDRRAGELGDIPATFFNTTDHPQVGNNEKNQPVPILLGDKENIIPVYVNYTGGKWVYQITETSFVNSYSMQSVDEVFLDGVEIYETYDYDVSLANGTISLYNDPKDAVVSCNCHGLKCAYNFATGVTTSLFTENVADLAFFVLTELNNIPVAQIDLPSFLELQTGRTQRLGIYLDTLTETMEVFRVMQMSAQFHIFPTQEGKYQVQYFGKDVEAVNKLFNPSLSISENTESAKNAVELKYNRNPSTDVWKTVKSINTNVEHKYRAKNQILQIDTYLVNDTEAENTAAYFAALCQEPLEKINLPQGELETLEYIPTQKIIVTKDIETDEKEINILDSEIYTILEIVKDVNLGRSEIVALKDSQSRGAGSYTDIPHLDEHTDSYSDSYTDTAHSDTHSDYYNNSHGDILHGDIAHDDEHTDSEGSHADSHTDEYTDHQDDVWHEDEHEDVYIDEPAPHYDEHTDVSHSDISHTDTHVDWYDNIHTDGHADQHTNIHTDEHGDEAHTDSEI